jgi:hypothetical protein
MSASHNRLPAVSLVLATGLLVLSHGVAVAEQARPSTAPDFRIVDFDEAMKHQIVRSMPLKLAFPADYDMLVLDPEINGVVWARRADLDHIARTKEVPPGAGVFHGRLTTRVGYDSAGNSFMCGPGCDEKMLQVSIKATGADVVRWQKARRQQHPDAADRSGDRRRARLRPQEALHGLYRGADRHECNADHVCSTWRQQGRRPNGVAGLLGRTDRGHRHGGARQIADAEHRR